MVEHIIIENGEWKTETLFDEIEEHPPIPNAVCLRCTHRDGTNCMNFVPDGYPPFKIPHILDKPISCDYFNPIRGVFK